MSVLLDEAAAPDTDPGDLRLVQSATGVLRVFNQAGVLAPAAVHVAMRLSRLGPEDDESVLLGAALAVRGPGLGHVFTDLATVRGSVAVDADRPVDLDALPWPEVDDWVTRLSISRLVAVGAGGEADRPLRLVGTRLYLDRYWREERRVAALLNERALLPAADVDRAVLRQGLDRLFPEDVPDPQRLAAATAVLRRLSVVAGGPGTGKTTIVALILALLHEQAVSAGRPAPLVGLAAPTGKAAARLEEAVHEEATGMDVDDAIRVRLLEASGLTLHRLLGWRPGSSTRFRHDAHLRLPHDVVVVDETSMVSLSLMAALVSALRPDARLVMVGDPEQLASVEAGAVLGDIVGPAADGLLLRPAARESLSSAAGFAVEAGEPPAGSAVGDGIVVLRKVHRFAGQIAELADAIRSGDAGRTVEVLSAGGDEVQWLAVEAEGFVAEGTLRPVREAVLAAGRPLVEAAEAGDGWGALKALRSFRLLCGHRRGPAGVATWMPRVERWLASGIDGFAMDGDWYLGRPLLMTENDYTLRLYNGDTGVVVASEGGRLRAAFERRGELVTFPPAKLGAVETVYAMTVHKSQGSQFATVALVLPPADSPILTRELLYTAVTRARSRVILVGTEAAVRTAVERPIARASGLREALWG